MIGITYRNRHSYRDMGVIVKTRARPIIAPVRTSESSVLYADGAVDYSEYGGRLYYDEKLIEIDLTVAARNLTELNKKISRIAGWLAGGWGDLIFDDMPYTVWIAKPINIESVAPELVRVGKTTVQFRCKPFNRLAFSYGGVRIGDKVKIGSRIRLNYGLDNVHKLSEGENLIRFNYIGTAPCAPTLRIKTSEIAKSLSIMLNGCIVNYSKSFVLLELDCEKWRACNNGADASFDISGDYPEMLPGINEISVTVDVSGELEIKFYPQYLYGDEGFDE